MSSDTLTRRLELQPDNASRIQTLCGLHNENIKLLERRLGIEIRSRGNQFELTGPAETAALGVDLLGQIYATTESQNDIGPEDIHLVLQEHRVEAHHARHDEKIDSSLIQTPKISVRPRGGNQRGYVESIKKHDISFGIGPAGTGKTWLAVACAAEALKQDRVRRILLVRPAVEAGEKLGFLPGDLAQKVDPYLRPLYDALYEMLGFEQVGRLIERQVIEVAPLAFMRGRTLNDAYIILDESQNTTREQMKMFLTRIGFGSKAVITGDPSQIDLPSAKASGLLNALDILGDVQGIGITHFQSKDVVRHPLVQRIVEAYDKKPPHAD